MIRTRTYVTLRHAAIVSALLVLGAIALLGRPQPPLVQSIPVGRGPVAVLLAGSHAIVANDGDGTVSVLDLDSARVIRTIAVGSPSTLAPLALALDERTHHLFVANRGDNGAPSMVRVLDSRDGAVRATVHVGPEADAVAVDERAGHALVATGGTGRVSLLAARSGAVLRTTRVGLAPVALAVDPRTARAFVLGTALLPSEEPDGGQTGLVGVLDTRSGGLVRTVVVGHAPEAIAVDARTARVFVANGGDDTVSVLDARTGVVLRTVRVGWTPAALAVDERDGRVFVVNEGESTLSVLGARSGALLRTVAVFPAATASMVTRPSALAVDEARTRVYVTSWGRLDQSGLPLGNGQLAILDARSGRLLHTIALGVAPEAVTTEAGSGRIVMVDSGGVIRAPVGWMEQRVRQVARWVPGLSRLVPRALDAVVVPGRVEVIDPGMGAG